MFLLYNPLYFLQVLYHVLGVVPAYQASIGSALNELCLGLQPDEVASVSPYHSSLFSVICSLKVFSY